MSGAGDFHLRIETASGEEVRARAFDSLGDAILAATRHLADNPGHVGVLAERRQGSAVHERVLRHRGVHVDPEVWALLVHLEWAGDDVRIEQMPACVSVSIAQGDRMERGTGETGTDAAEDALRRWSAPAQ